MTWAWSRSSAFRCNSGIEAVVITSDQFLRRPIVWAELIGKYRATITSGPNFAYSILARASSKAATPMRLMPLIFRRFG